MSTFERQLAVGHDGQARIVDVLIRRGCEVVLIAREGDKSGPRLLRDKLRDLVLPDLQVFKNGGGVFVESKTKSHWTWYGMSQTWQTGVDASHFSDYLEVKKSTGMEVWLLFLHTDASTPAKDMSFGGHDQCPVGLWGQCVEVLEQKIDHFYPGYGTGGMVYWNKEDLWHLASIDDDGCIVWVADDV